MAIWDGIKRQLRSVIEWDNASPATLFQVWSENGDEIKNASKLLVKPGQGVIFLYEGKIEAIHLEAGLYELSTANIPFWTTITKFMQAFESEHKVGIFYFWQTEFVNQKWGTATPVRYDDPVYRFPVELRAHGNFTFRITKPEYFFTNIVGSRSTFTTEEAKRVITDRFVQQLADLLAESGFSYAQIDANRNELAAKLILDLKPVCQDLGFEMTDFRIEGTSFDEETKRRIGRIADLTAEAQAAQAAGLNYAQIQQLEALRDAARNEGGLAGAGVGIGAGFGLGQAFGAGMSNMAMGSAQAQPTPQQDTAGQDVATRLAKLKKLFEAELISSEDYEKRKQEILADV